RLAPTIDDPSVETRVLNIGGARVAVIAERDVSQAPGFSHIRNSFVHDASFDWDETPASNPHYDSAIEFLCEDRGVVVALSFNEGCAQVVGSDRRVSMRPVAAEIESFVHEQFPKQPADAR